MGMINMSNYLAPCNNYYLLRFFLVGFCFCCVFNYLLPRRGRGRALGGEGIATTQLNYQLTISKVF
jgi:hypothetical protein